MNFLQFVKVSVTRNVYMIKNKTKINDLGELLHSYSRAVQNISGYSRFLSLNIGLFKK